MEISNIITACSPIITALLTLLFTALKDKNGKLAKIEQKLDEHIRVDDERNAVQCRIRIVRFAEEIRERTPHQERYQQIFEDCRIYNSYCEEHPNFKNEVTVESEKLIREDFHKHFEAGDLPK